MTKVMLSCGEPSGDLYAGALTTEILRLEPEADVSGLGGERLLSAGGRLVSDYDGLAVTGLAETLPALPRFWATYRRLVRAARTERPDVFVAIDYPDFNFRLGASMAALGIPVIYYISPQVWAWRAGRLRTMKRFVTRALVIFPFEEALYRDAGIPVAFVGHPLVDLAVPVLGRDAFRSAHGLDAEAPTVAVLPGSRPNELRVILPDLVNAAERLVRDVPSVQFVVARAPNLPDALFEPLARLTELGARPPCIVESQTDDVLVAADVVLTASGTATIQTAIHERPMVVVYRLSPLTYWMGRRFVRVKAFGMVNLVAEKMIAPEFLQEAFTPEAVAGEAVRFLTDESYVLETRAALRAVREKLGGPGASRRAAEQVLAAARTPGRQ
ncbi:MAG: lipid-A-disaccharide synthase [Vicinamibacterales bacterium]|jgi:lipid-A-disaccharide synthase|nr:lipid-A-disaccharide synthase [Vicinamibacterales bacterium]MDP7479518.1 lipid-A-disaccharide synthase [Vicinamibacterales bacterium]MDP7690205.1 lipid-A-disaccharide synthase [Vicinamibacterales bacterium]HJN45137.1 lipid-A-disaccharide synthase [Vicinamibacterales bacterium]